MAPEVPIHVDTGSSLSRSELQPSSPNLLSAASGYASTVCRFCSCSAVTFPFPGWPDLCVGGGERPEGRGWLGTLWTVTASQAARRQSIHREGQCARVSAAAQELRCPGRVLWSCPSNDCSHRMTSMVAILPSHRLRSSGKTVQQVTVCSGGVWGLLNAQPPADP